MRGRRVWWSCLLMARLRCGLTFAKRYTRNGFRFLIIRYAWSYKNMCFLRLSSKIGIQAMPSGVSVAAFVASYAKPLQKHYEHTGFPWEPIENNMRTHDFLVNLIKAWGKHILSMWTYGKHKENTLSVGTYGKHYENTRFPLEPMENIRATHVFYRNLWKTLRKHKCSIGTYGKH